MEKLNSHNFGAAFLPIFNKSRMHAFKTHGPRKSLFEPSHEKTKTGFLTRSDLNLPVQSQEQARSLKFWI